MFRIWSSLKNYSIVWVSYWLLVMGVLVLGIKPAGHNYSNSPLLITCFFLASALIGFKLFALPGLFYEHINLKNQIHKILLFYLLVFFSLLLFDYYFPLSFESESALREGKFFFPLLGFSPVVTKYFDILFQQTMILSYIYSWKVKGIADKTLIQSFAVTFFLLHIPTFVEFGWFSLAFTIPSAGAGILFSYFMLKFKEGLFYSFAIHLVFYVILGLSLRYHYS